MQKKSGAPIQKGSLEIPELSDKEKLRLLFQNQRQRLSYLLGPKRAKAYLESQPIGRTLTQYMLQEQWVADYNLILMCRRAELIGTQTANVAFEQVKQKNFNIALLAK